MLKFIDATKWNIRYDLRKESRRNPGALIYAVEREGSGKYSLRGYISIKPDDVKAVHEACLEHFGIESDKLIMTTDTTLDPSPVSISISNLDDDAIEAIAAKCDGTDLDAASPFKYEFCHIGDLGEDICDAAYKKRDTLIYYCESVDDDIGTRTVVGYIVTAARNAIPMYDALTEHFSCSRDFIDVRQERAIYGDILYRVECVRCKPGTISADTPREDNGKSKTKSGPIGFLYLEGRRDPNEVGVMARNDPDVFCYFENPEDPGLISGYIYTSKHHMWEVVDVISGELSCHRTDIALSVSYYEGDMALMSASCRKSAADNNSADPSSPYYNMMSRFAVPLAFSERCIEIEGSQYQDLCLLEECAEVVKEITKIDRKEKAEADVLHLTEEVGDLLIVLQTAIVNHGLSVDAIVESMKGKIDRTEKFFASKGE